MLSTPVFVYEASVKYQVPAASPSIRVVVVAGAAISRICVRLPADCPYRTL
jgi:hypothetical protein